ncbi:MAG: bifunctional demethylmenaquinone methyltransferase/2-methoxy-6-polyprenyl-1,4-benzoquinol methylase UbiE [Ferrovibrio sp.]|uniref:bifunctional demethylmenaquinone methyltransferase/2-methoxy-6-polyprenyl-1,4-benzoquinol methylase UbiE n=1 Tax=Ferrovibrio sp. TaxID=1917215 RepID=UPI00262C1082|nr:bifunctional demethylmenaquinone methyltransferase/2-methoxy-6-polyprenyl-1,4-benzoquinol methylase UbiE [Ferrovibrio sp.]MCW0235608.1 bifunctional demethylmenaquinone methyltransferase/2-methoxy-6-polyprenyl-1,4-benzoquinol methylase UbiE [Ferrovibrio sp.]
MSQPDPTQDSNPGNETHFGFRSVPEGDKARLVRGVFDSVASRYDVMNDLMSGGVHRLWKAAMIDWLNPHGAITVLDVAGGTGDIAFRILDRAPQSKVIVADINASMLEQGRNRAIDQARLGRLTWTCMDAEKLALPDRSVDAYTIAFGIRNVTHIEAALAEAYRVLKPGGRFLCLEFSTVRNPALAKVYDIYSFNLLPKLGGIVADDADSYRYLVESIRRFPSQERFAAMIEAAGFRNVAVRDLTGGIAAMHSARRI